MDGPVLPLSLSFCAGWANGLPRPSSTLPFCASRLLVPALGGQLRCLVSMCTHWGSHLPPLCLELPVEPAGCALPGEHMGALWWWRPLLTLDKEAKRRAWGEVRSSDWFPGCPNREQRDPIYLKDKVTQRHSKEQFETAQKIEQEYSRYFTGRCASGLERRSRWRGRMQASQGHPS